MPDTLTPQQQADLQARYDELLKRGTLKSDPNAAAWGHELRSRGLITDPTQGGTVASTPAPAPAPTGAIIKQIPGSSTDPYGDPADQKTAAPVPQKTAGGGYISGNGNYYPPPAAPTPSNLFSAYTSHAPHPTGAYTNHDVLHPTPTLSENYVTKYLIPSAKANIEAAIESGANMAGGAFGLQSSPFGDQDAASAQAQRAVSDLNPAGVLKTPVGKGAIKIAQGGLRLLDTRGGYTESPYSTIGQGVRQIGQAAHDDPVGTALTVGPFLFDGIKGVFKDPLTGADISAVPKEATPPSALRPVTKPLPTPAAVMDNIAKGAQEAAPKPAPVLSPVEAATATAHAVANSPSLTNVAVSPAEFQSFLKSLHPGITDGEAADIVANALPKDQTPPAVTPPVQEAPNVPQQAVTPETQTPPVAAAPTGQPTPVPPVPDVVPQVAGAQPIHPPAEAVTPAADPRLMTPEQAQANLDEYNTLAAKVLKKDGTPRANAKPADIDRMGQLRQAAKDHQDAVAAQAVSPPEPAPAPAPEPAPPPAEPQATAAPEVAPVPAKKAPAEYIGDSSINKRTLDASPEVLAATERNVGVHPVQRTTIPEITSRSMAMGLQPEQLSTLKPGDVPAGVPPPEFVDAVVSLAKAQGVKVADAEQAYRDNPTPENMQAVQDADATHAAVLQHEQALKREFGQTGAVLNKMVTAFQAAQDATQGKRQALAQAASLKPDELPETPRAPRAPSKRVITDEMRDAALKRIRDASGRLNSGLDPTVLADYAVVGAHKLETGIRKFADWAAEMTKDIPKFGTFDAAGQQQVYAASRAAYASTAKSNLRQTGQLVFADALAGRLGRQGASDFIDALADHPLHPDLLGKVLRNDPLSQDERGAVNEAYRANQPGRGSRTAPSQQSLTVINAINKEFADANRRANLAKAKVRRQATRAAAKATSPPKVKIAPDAYTRTLTGRVGRANVAEFERRLSADSDTANVADKLRNGDELSNAEKRAVASHLDDLRKPAKKPVQTDASKTLQGIVRDAKAGRLGYADAKTAVREELNRVMDSAKRAQFTADMAHLGDNDFQGLAKVYNKYYPHTVGDKIRAYQMNALLSGPMTLGKIIVTHGLSVLDEETGVRALAHLYNPALVEGVNPAAGRYVLSAMRDALHGAKIHLTQGATAAHLHGLDPGYDLQGHAISREALGGKAAWLNLPLRIHGAVYHILGEGLEARGRFEAANLKAKAQGGDAAAHLGDKDVVQAGKRFRKEQMFQNKNALAAAGNAAAGIHPLIEGGVNAIAPFREIPSNIAGRALENTGGGLPVGIARERFLRKNGTDFTQQSKVNGKWTPKQLTAEERAAVERNIAYQKARGTLGLVKIGAGAAAGAYGLINAPNAKRHEYGSVNTGKNGKYSVGVSELGSASAPYLAAAAAVDAAKGRGKWSDVAAPLLDNPITRGATDLAAIGEPGGVSKFAGGIAGQAIPTGLAQAAAVLDPSGQIRSKTDSHNDFNAFLNQLRNRLPVGKVAGHDVGRFALRPSGHAQATNVKSIGVPLTVGSGLLGLPVTPRERR